MGNVHRQMQLGFVVMPAGLALQLLTMLLIARHLGPGLFGIYAVIMGIVNIANFVVTMGIGTIITKFVAEARRPTSYYVALSLPIVIVFTLAAGIVLVTIACAAYSIPVAGGAALLAAANILLFGVSVVFSSALRGLNQIEKWLAWFFVQKVVALAVVLGLLQPLSGGLTLAMSTWTLANFVSLFYAAAALWGKNWRGQLRWSPREVRSLVSESTTVTLIAGVTRLSLEAENFVLAILMPEYVVGVYAAGRRVVDAAANILNGAVSVPTFPRLCRLAGTDAREFGRWTSQLCQVLWIASLTLGLVAFVVAPLAIALLLKADYGDSSKVIQITVWCLAPMMLSNQLRYVYIALSRQARFLGLSVLYLVVKVLVLIGLTWRFGLWGTCCGTVLAEFVLMVLVRVGAAWLGIPVRLAWREVAATVVTAGCLLMLWWLGSTVWMPAVIVIVYGVLAAYVVNGLLRTLSAGKCEPAGS